MSTHSTIYVGNTSVIQIGGLVDHDGAYANDATVTLQSIVEERTGAAVDGVTVPLPLNYVAESDGQYVGSIGYDAGLAADRWYLATIRAESEGKRGQWVERIRAAVRRG